MITDLPEISVGIISAFQNFCELASRWRIQLVLLSSLFHSWVGSERSAKDPSLHPTDADHQKVSWILGTLQDLVQGCDILFVCVVPSLELLVQHPRVSI